MSAADLKNASNGCKNISFPKEQQEKVAEVRKLAGPVPEKFSIFCSDASISRYLRASNWNVKKATKILKETIKWRLEYKPEEIRWDEVAHEAETGKLYVSNYTDKHGRTVIVMRPSRQNTNSTKEQMRYFAYCMENAIMNLQQNQEEMIWLVDFHGYNISHISIKSTRETAYFLQHYYPERLGMAILYNPPKFFEPFYMMARPFLEQKTADRVKFVYSDNANTKKIMEDLFDMDKLESAFGGKDEIGFDIEKYAERMRGEDKKTRSFWESKDHGQAVEQPSLTNLSLSTSMKSDTPTKVLNAETKKLSSQVS